MIAPPIPDLPAPPVAEEPALPPRGGCLTAFLVALIALNVLGILALLCAGPTVQRLLADWPPWFGPVSVVGDLLELACLVGVWRRQRWGVYGVAALTAVGCVL